MWVHKQPNITEKLSVLSQASQYDLACSCGTNKEDHRKRSKENSWIYPVSLPNGGKTILFKTLLSNECRNNCRYCPFRLEQDIKRCTIESQELAKEFLQYYHRREVFGLFLSSGVISTPDTTMEKINSVGQILRKMNFKGYLHLKIIPGASEAAIRETISIASAVSLNIETAGEDNFNDLCPNKNYKRDVLKSIKLISDLTAKGSRYSQVKQTTQFVVGATKETDKEILNYTWALYKQLNLDRVYFSAYQRGLGDLNLAGENSQKTNEQLLQREHRLYQVDWLFRKYGFSYNEIPLEEDGNLPLTFDPKEFWALNHKEFFPININKASKYELLRVPGLGHVAVKRILDLRRRGDKISSLKGVISADKLMQKAQKYIEF